MLANKANRTEVELLRIELDGATCEYEKNRATMAEHAARRAAADGQLVAILNLEQRYREAAFQMLRQSGHSEIAALESRYGAEFETEMASLRKLLAPTEGDG